MKTGFVKIIDSQGEKWNKEILQPPFHALHPPKHANCMCHPCCWTLCDSFPANSVFHVIIIKCFPLLGVTSVLIVRKRLFSRSHIDFVQQHGPYAPPGSYSVSPELVLPWAKRPTRWPSQAAHRCPPPALACRCSGCSFPWCSSGPSSGTGLAGWSWPPMLQDCLFQLELSAHGILWGFLTSSPDRPKGKKSKGRKFCCSCISSLIFCHSIKNLLRLQVGQQYNLFHSIHTVSLPSFICVCVPR